MESVHRSFVDALVGERIGGRYVVERVLRAGGMGVVAAGRYPELDQEVAIKFMRPELAANPILSARFLREARLAARVKSPHFVRVFDFGRTDGGVPYLVMEMLAGRDVRDELDSRGRLPIGEAVDYVLQAAVGIAEIHSYGVVHRDLKPSNLFLAEAAGTRIVKVLDFGISKERVEEATGLTNTGNVVGTPHYMSPEQIRESKTADVRSDIWSLGVILYELLCDAVPFGEKGEAVGEVYGLVLHTAPIPPSARGAQIPPTLEAVIVRCLEREPAARFATVAELAEALRPFAETGSLHRIEAVRKALETSRLLASDSDPSPAVPSAGAFIAAKGGRPSSRAATLPQLVASAASPVNPPQETEMTATRGPDANAGHGFARYRGLAGGAALVLLGALTTLALTHGKGDAPPAPTTPVAAAPAAPSMPTPSASPAPPPPVPTPPAPSPASPSATTAAEIPHPPSAPSPRPAHRASPPHPAAAASAPSAPDLLLDRK